MSPCQPGKLNYYATKFEISQNFCLFRPKIDFKNNIFHDNFALYFDKNFMS